ncbi:uncharacterized protein DUF2786 [Krasilnikovia cinnamomea]|uniref:Uncharacterized protein DUF2786 n=1 Tax=Krasilnikovia cinnamomea TaxID=349313 RepID=A0A4Q7ZKD9_9ACTN|nr:DUF2786 domain-containing protein [Krasilnikovia cinnamomea]RZU50735.1 uncharacterized protein DUF2786 [Krasilnikovia cinnamomea]
MTPHVPAPDGPDPGMLDKVRKLLAKAEDEACTPAEAEAFTAKAADLIAKYGIDQALLADSAPGVDVVGDRVIEMDAPYARDKAGLLAGIAHALRCKTVRRTQHTPGDGKRISMHLFGFGADLDRVELLYTSLLVQAAHALAAASVPWGEHPASYRRSWYAGYATAIHRRLQAAEARAQVDAEHAHISTQHSGRSVALVLADRGALVDRAQAAAYPKLAAGRARRLSGSGDRDGYAAGQRADLGANRIGRSGRKAVW